MSSINSVASVVRKESQNGRVVTCSFRCCRKALGMKFEGLKTACNKEVNKKNSHLTRGTWSGERMGAANKFSAENVYTKLTFAIAMPREHCIFCNCKVHRSQQTKTIQHDDDKRVAGAVRFEIYSANTFCSFRCHTRLHRMRQNNGRYVLPMSAVDVLHKHIYCLLFGIPWRRTAYERCVVPAIIFAFLLNLFMFGFGRMAHQDHRMCCFITDWDWDAKTNWNIGKLECTSGKWRLLNAMTNWWSMENLGGQACSRTLAAHPNRKLFIYSSTSDTY